MQESNSAMRRKILHSGPFLCLISARRDSFCGGFENFMDLRKSFVLSLLS